jgi:excisionase family DNA binding protein
MSATARRRFEEMSLPTTQEAEIAKSSSRLLAACIGEGETARIRVINGHEEIVVPVSALRMLVEILAQMSKGNGVTLMPIHAELTTQEAADFLNVSRPFVVGLIERQELPATRVGTHRRVKFQDLIEYRQRSLTARKNILNEMTSDEQAEGRYE